MMRGKTSAADVQNQFANHTGAYFKGTLPQHALATSSGGIVGRTQEGATMVSALWGVLVWKEFSGAGSKVRILLTLMFVLFLAGLILVAVAPLYVR